MAYRFGYRVLLGLAALSVLALGLASLAQAQGVEVNERTPVTFAVASPCAAEPVIIEGTFHFMVNITEDRGGGSHAVTHITLIGQGVGASGDRYIVQDRNNAHNKIDLDSADNSTLVADFHVVRQGETSPGDDFTLRTVIHLTQNANGEPTATVSDVVAECR